MSKSLIRRRKILDWEHWKVLTVPNMLTFVRMGVLPFLVGAFLTDWPWRNWVALGLFAIAGLTDYADGYIARRYQQASKFGAFLDPIADKLLVSTTLLMMAGTGFLSSWHLIPAAVILCREFIISGLREFLAASGQELRVSRLAQYKTTIQLLSIGFILSDLTPWIVAIGLTALWTAAILALVTGLDYIKLSFGFVKRRQRLSERLRWARHHLRQGKTGRKSNF